MADFNVIAKIQANVSDFQRGLASAKTSLESFQKQTGGTFERVGKTMQSVGKSLTKGVTLPLLAVGAYATKTGAEFESAMSKVSALSGATGKDLSTLEKAAREMGRTTRYGSTEAANALSYMSLAGWDTQQMVKGLKPVLNLASAGQMDLAQASDIVTDMMSMFGLEAEQAGRATDVFAVAQANSNTTVSQLGEALKKSGSAAAAAGQSLEDTSAILGVLANNGIKGSEAGTALNAMFRDLQAAAVDGKVAIGDTSVAVYDANGNMRSMVDIIADVEKATEGMTQEQKHNALASIFQQRSLKGMNTLLNSGSGELKKLQGELNNSTGAAQIMADEMDNNLKGSFMKLKSAMEDIGIAISQMTSGPLKAIVDWAKDLALKFQELSPHAQQLIVIFGAVAAAIGPLLWIFGAIVQKIPFILKGFKLLGLAFGAITSPIGLVVAGIGVLIGVLVYLYKTNERVREVFDSVWNAIKNVVTTIVEAIRQVIQNVFIRVAKFIMDNQELIKETIETVWTEVSEFVTEVLEAIVPIVKWAWETIKALTETVWNLIKDVIMIALELILGIIKAVMQAINGDWEGAWETIKETAVKVWGLIVEAVTEFMTNLFEAIVVFLTPIVEFFIEMWESVKQSTIEKWEAIVAFFTETIPELVQNIITWFQKLPQKITEFFLEIIESARLWIEDMLIKAEEIGTGFVQAIIDYFNKLPERIGFVIGYVLASIAKWVVEMVAKAIELGTDFVNSVVSFFQQLPGKIQQWITNAYNNVVRWSSDMVSKAKETGTNFLNGVIEFFSQLPGKTWNWLTQTIQRVLQWGVQLVQKGRQAATEMVNAVINGVSRLPGEMYSAGMNVVKGFWNGIVALGGWLKSQVTGFFSGIINGAKSALGIHSPSREFMKLGKFVPPGFGKGIDKAAKKATKPVGSLMDKVVKTASGVKLPLPDLTSFAGDMAMAMDVGTSQNITHSLDESVNRPIKVHTKLNVGGYEFREFTQTITEQQQSQDRLERNY